MKRIEQKLIYDTETAELIGTTTFKDLGEELLYKTPNGNYFYLSCPSGGDSYITVEDSIEEAYKWAQKELDPDVVIRFFGDMLDVA